MANISSRISSNRDILYRANLLIVRRRPGKVDPLTVRHSDFVINVIKGRYVLCRRTCVFCENTTEAIHSDALQLFPYANKVVVVFPINPIAKQFPTISNCHPHINSSTKP